MTSPRIADRLYHWQEMPRGDRKVRCPKCDRYMPTNYESRVQVWARLLPKSSSNHPTEGIGQTIHNVHRHHSCGSFVEVAQRLRPVR